MRVDSTILNSMFLVAGFSKQALYDALRTMGAKAIKPKMRYGWSEEMPAWCACYFVSEMIYWYVAPKGTTPYSMKVPGDPGTHRFLMWPDGTIVDATCEQFPNYSLVDYTTARVTPFMQTGCRGPSVRARELAVLLGFSESAWRKP